MARVLRKVKEFEFKNGWLGEYVFQDDRGRVYASRISDCAVNNTTTAEFHNKKSIHAIRRTLNSNMKCAGVSGTVAVSLLGHTEKVNEEYIRCEFHGRKEQIHGMCWKSIKKTFTSYETIVTKIVRKVNVSNR